MSKHATHDHAHEANAKTFRAIHRGAPMSPRKARYVVDLIRGKPVNEALDTLRFCTKRAAPLLTKVVMSALANAQLDAQVDHNRLHVVDIRADAGPVMKRHKIRARGQIFPRLSRMCHLTVVLAEREPKARRTRGGADRSRKARVEASRKAESDAGGGTPAAKGKE
jgi:large subunit ribosomal protein L22